jgi:hypothetical protein
MTSGYLRRALAFSAKLARRPSKPTGTCLAELGHVNRKSRLRARGVTRFELTAVAGAVAVVALGALFAVRPRLAAADTDEALKDAARIRSAVQDWRRENGQGCPTLSQLIHEKHLDQASPTDDPWGERYRVRCTDDEVTVVSPGQDHRPNTSDDIRVPRSG